MEVEGFKKISDGDPEPAVGASVGEGVEHGVAEPALLVDEEPRGGGGEGVALADEGVVGDDAGEGLVNELQTHDLGKHEGEEDALDEFLWEETESNGIGS